MHKISIFSLVLIFAVAGFPSRGQRVVKQPVHIDKPFLQDYSIKFYSDTTKMVLGRVASDWNGTIQVLSNKGLQHTFDGQFLYHGTIEADNYYRFMSDKKITSISSYQNQLVYLTDAVVFSNAWAGKLFSAHTLPGASLFAGGKDFTFLVSDGKALQLIKDSKNLWSGSLANDEVIGIRFQESTGQFWILGEKSLNILSDNKLTKVLDGANFTAFDINNQNVVIGTKNGYIDFSIASKKQVGEVHRKLPVLQQ
jgi:hypothetical protein